MWGRVQRGERTRYFLPLFPRHFLTVSGFSASSYSHGMIGIRTDKCPDLERLWGSTVVAVTHERCTVTAPLLLRRLLLNERRRLCKKYGAGWLERIEREYYRPKRKPSATTAPPPAPDSFID